MTDSVKLVKALTEYLDGREYDFIDMEWHGNQYTGEGKEYPKIDTIVLENILYRFFEEFGNDRL
jgi:hypothetical protein